MEHIIVDLETLGKRAGCRVLKHLYATFGVALPWEHWQEMCARTVRTFSGVDPEQFRVLPKHNPTNDILTEVRWLKSSMATLFGRMAG